MNRKWIVIALALALAFVACKNIEEGGEIQPPAPEQGSGENPGGNGGANQGGEQKPGGSENPSGNEGEQKPEEGNEGNEGGNQGGEGGGEQNPTPENPTTKAASDLLKEILTEAEYNRISEELSSKNITLTAQTIKAIGDNFSVLVKDAENGSAQDTTKTVVNSNKEAFVAQDKNLINVTKTDNKYSLNSYNTNVVFSGEFNLSEISLPKNNGKGNFTNATLTNNGEDITLDKFNDIRGTSLPTLKFNNVKYSAFYMEETGFHSYKLYKDYADELGKLTLTGNLQGITVNGAKDKDGNLIDGYTLIKEDNNTVKKSSDDTIKSLPVDALIQMYKQLGIQKFVNMIISGIPTEAVEVDWSLTNMVFEGNMDKIKNIGTQALTGIVYFKGKPYNNINIDDSNRYQYVYGVLKLDELTGVSYNTFGISLSSNSAVLDVRGGRASAL